MGLIIISRIRRELEIMIQPQPSAVCQLLLGSRAQSHKRVVSRLSSQRPNSGSTCYIGGHLSFHYASVGELVKVLVYFITVEQPIRSSCHRPLTTYVLCSSAVPDSDIACHGISSCY